MICASEDVGNADPQALVMAVNASLAVERVGMPEAQIILAQAVTYIATAPKSNRSCEAVFQGCRKYRPQEICRSPHTCRMHIIKEQQNWDTEQDINMHMITRMTMWNNSISLMS